MLKSDGHTHTHTHIYIYIYNQINSLSERSVSSQAWRASCPPSCSQPIPEITVPIHSSFLRLPRPPLLFITLLHSLAFGCCWLVAFLRVARTPETQLVSHPSPFPNRRERERDARTGEVGRQLQWARHKGKHARLSRPRSKNREIRPYPSLAAVAGEILFLDAAGALPRECLNSRRPPCPWRASWVPARSKMSSLIPGRSYRRRPSRRR